MPGPAGSADLSRVRETGSAKTGCILGPLLKEASLLPCCSGLAEGSKENLDLLKPPATAVLLLPGQPLCLSVAFPSLAQPAGALEPYHMPGTHRCQDTAGPPDSDHFQGLVGTCRKPGNRQQPTLQGGDTKEQQGSEEQGEPGEGGRNSARREKDLNCWLNGSLS